jgi:hypothetical protein
MGSGISVGNPCHIRRSKAFHLAVMSCWELKVGNMAKKNFLFTFFILESLQLATVGSDRKKRCQNITPAIFLAL